MPSKNERVELEMKIIWYRQLGVDRTADEEFPRRIGQPTSKAASVASGR